MLNLCLSNIVYGQPYTDIFLNFHLKSLLENFNYEDFGKPAYLIFTEQRNLSTIQSHDNFIKLKCKFTIELIVLEGIVLDYETRYNIQNIQVEHSAKFALDNNLLLHIATADIYYGVDFFKNALKHIRNGHDCVVSTPIRAAYESASSHLSGNQLSVDDLFDVGFYNMHPLWTSANWDNPLFAKHYYNLLWTDEKSICLRAFSQSPILFWPMEWMLNSNMGCIDITFLPHFKNCYYIPDWSEMPSIELGQLSNFYPPFWHKKSNIQEVADWVKIYIIPENRSNLSRYTIFKKTNDSINEELIFKSKLIADAIMLTAKF